MVVVRGYLNVAGPTSMDGHDSIFLSTILRREIQDVFRFSDSSPTMIRRRRIAESQALLFFAFLPAFATRVDDVLVVFFPPSLVALRARLGLMGSVISSIRSEIALDDFRATRLAPTAAPRTKSAVSSRISGFSNLYQRCQRLLGPVGLLLFA